jgi:CheY-like chemotaxis protein
MPSATNVLLLVDPDTRTRQMIASQLVGVGRDILIADDAPAALQILAASLPRILMTELYLHTGEDECLIHAVRRDPRFSGTRIVAHTHRCLPEDREWAMRAGADAYLIKPTRPNRVRYVVGRLLTAGARRSSLTATCSAPMSRRPSLEEALREIEAGQLMETSTIVFGRSWWQGLTDVDRRGYRARARRAHINLRSDSMLGTHFVEVRGRQRDAVGLPTEQPESPYRR